MQIGTKFGKWEVISQVFKSGRYKGWKRTCRCECGNVKEIREHDLNRSATNSCKECAPLKHGHARSNTTGRTSEYSSWEHAKQRCNNPNDLKYPDYGDRGIIFHEPWAKSFQAFLDYMGPKPDSTYSIDRIDVDGNYEPGNVRWADKSTQSANQRRWLKPKIKKRKKKRKNDRIHGNTRRHDTGTKGAGFGAAQRAESC